jgi:hypothetical protein
MVKRAEYTDIWDMEARREVQSEKARRKCGEFLTDILPN